MSDAPPRTDEKKPPRSEAQARKSRALAEAVVTTFIDRLIAEANQRGGALTMRDLAQLSDEFRAKTDALSKVFEQTLEESSHVQKVIRWQTINRPPFDRLIVKRFETLFPRHGEAIGEGRISRRMLPGFFLAVNIMLGADVVKTFQDKCQEVVDRLKADNNGDIDWNLVDADPRAQRIILDAQMQMVTHFSDLRTRKAWFLRIINDQLAPTALDGPDVGWEMTPDMFEIFLRRLFSDLIDATDSVEGRLKEMTEYGADKLEAAVAFLHQLRELSEDEPV
ncbi:hypothetical protein [Varunaivibrio sulfuroxidans]|uniref:Uncharacterized protein n=1 Tax=Varunaivibrio sulfuroxidans TaxID=1773489 RepID=A0A4R3J7W1_9PROT|nr:hypothetical protein [Varunaivibrio sulfuroxidans]TCS60580.1 hypothetical protein EDD55_11054 [Varunaivibrio sulfuroxidans]WES30071.1 hypothetical protein P3M64_10535 [Varunaivibrio sulfuroxidans]